MSENELKDEVCLICLDGDDLKRNDFSCECKFYIHVDCKEEYLKHSSACPICDLYITNTIREQEDFERNNKNLLLSSLVLLCFAISAIAILSYKNTVYDIQIKHNNIPQGKFYFKYQIECEHDEDISYTDCNINVVKKYINKQTDVDKTVVSKLVLLILLVLLVLLPIREVNAESIIQPLISVPKSTFKISEFERTTS